MDAGTKLLDAWEAESAIEARGKRARQAQGPHGVFVSRSDLEALREQIIQLQRERDDARNERDALKVENERLLRWAF